VVALRTYILATQEVEIGASWSRLSVKRDPIQNTSRKESWRLASGDKTPFWQVQGPEFKSHTAKEEVEKEEESI
jgi:hypothetical protein